MLYHTAQISLNLPFLTSEHKTEVPSLTAPAKLVTDAIKICGTSVDLVLSILRRFKSQYTLKNAPLVLVQGAITAADASLAMMHFQLGDKPMVQDKYFRLLDEALLELSYSWAIAADAREGLQNLLFERQSTKEVVISNTAEVSEQYPSPILSGCGSGCGSHHTHAPSLVESGHGMDFPEPDLSNMFSFSAFDMANPYLWDPDLLTGHLPESQNSDTGILLDNEAVNFGDGLDCSSINYL
jgi:hypothetical protein